MVSTARLPFPTGDMELLKKFKPPLKSHGPAGGVKFFSMCPIDFSASRVCIGKPLVLIGPRAGFVPVRASLLVMLGPLNEPLMLVKKITRLKKGHVKHPEAGPPPAEP